MPAGTSTPRVAMPLRLFIIENFSCKMAAFSASGRAWRLGGDNESLPIYLRFIAGLEPFCAKLELNYVPCYILLSPFRMHPSRRRFVLRRKARCRAGCMGLALPHCLLASLVVRAVLQSLICGPCCAAWSIGAHEARRKSREGRYLWKKLLLNRKSGARELGFSALSVWW